MEQCLAIFKRIDLREGRQRFESQKVALVSYNLFTFHGRNAMRQPPGSLQNELIKAEFHQKEAIRIVTALHGKDRHAFLKQMI